MVWFEWRGRRAKYAIQLIDSGLLIMDFSDRAGNSFGQGGADQSMQYVQKSNTPDFIGLSGILHLSCLFILNEVENLCNRDPSLALRMTVAGFYCLVAVYEVTVTSDHNIL